VRDLGGRAGVLNITTPCQKKNSGRHTGSEHDSEARSPKSLPSICGITPPSTAAEDFEAQFWSVAADCVPRDNNDVG